MNAEGTVNVVRWLAVFVIGLEVFVRFDSGLPFGKVGLREVVGFQPMKKANQRGKVVIVSEAKGIRQVAVLGGGGLFNNFPGCPGIEGSELFEESAGGPVAPVVGALVVFENIKMRNELSPDVFEGVEGFEPTAEVGEGCLIAGIDGKFLVVSLSDEELEGIGKIPSAKFRPES